MKGISEAIKIEAKKQKGSVLLCKLDASLLGNLLTGKGTIGAGESTIRAGQKF